MHAEYITVFDSITVNLTQTSPLQTIRHQSNTNTNTKDRCVIRSTDLILQHTHSISDGSVIHIHPHSQDGSNEPQKTEFRVFPASFTDRCCADSATPCATTPYPPPPPRPPRDPSPQPRLEPFRPRISFKHVCHSIAQNRMNITVIRVPAFMVLQEGVLYQTLHKTAYSAHATIKRFITAGLVQFENGQVLYNRRFFIVGSSL